MGALGYRIEKRRSPLLNSVESLDLGNRDKDDNSLLSSLGVNLLGRRDLQLPQLALELGDILLEVDEGLSDLLLDLGRRSGWGVGGPLDLVLDRHDACRLSKQEGELVNVVYTRARTVWPACDRLPSRISQTGHARGIGDSQGRVSMQSQVWHLQFRRYAIADYVEAGKRAPPAVMLSTASGVTSHPASHTVSGEALRYNLLHASFHSITLSLLPLIECHQTRIAITSIVSLIAY